MHGGQPYKIADEDPDLVHLGEHVVGSFTLRITSRVFFRHARRRSIGWELCARARAFEPEKQELESWPEPLHAP